MAEVDQVQAIIAGLLGRGYSEVRARGTTKYRAFSRPTDAAANCVFVSSTGTEVRVGSTAATSATTSTSVRDALLREGGWGLI